MDLQLHRKRALVTGSTAGIGLAIAPELAQEGAAVVIIGRSQAKLDQALEAVRQGSRDARAVLADVTSAEGVGHLGHEVPDVDILVNNLGTYEPKEFTEICDEDWLRIFNINVMSGVRLSRHYLPGMLRRNWGRIVFVSSESAVNIPSEMIHYGVTKTAQVSSLAGLRKTLRDCRMDVLGRHMIGLGDLADRSVFAWDGESVLLKSGGNVACRKAHASSEAFQAKLLGVGGRGIRCLHLPRILDLTIERHEHVEGANLVDGTCDDAPSHDGSSKHLPLHVQAGARPFLEVAPEHRPVEDQVPSPKRQSNWPWERRSP